MVDSSPDLDPRYLGSKAPCDVVMKGGVTSGVVYPPALCALATKHRIRNVGGTSAGAIAAAGAAAAEFGRESGGFTKLQRLSEWVGADRNLLGLFQPTPDAKPLFDLALDAMDLQKTKSLTPRALLRRLTSRVNLASGIQRADAIKAAGLAGAVGAIVLLLCALVFALAGGRDWTAFLVSTVAVLVVALAVAGAAAGWFVSGVARRAESLARIATVTLPENHFGMCRGRTEPYANAAALTDWLHAQIQDMAGLGADDPPLTIGDLQSKPNVGDDEASITLRMFTTCLTQSQPYILPFDRLQFLFERAEMLQFFPERVVDHLWATGASRDYLPDGYRYLPIGGDLPVVVAARMSLSFPVLFSAVPLYTVSFNARRVYQQKKQEGKEHRYAAAGAGDDLQREWFSDGGISSNFPIHFFDALLPNRPTFGISLASMPNDATAAGSERYVSVPPNTDLSSDEQVEAFRSAVDPQSIAISPPNREKAAVWRPVTSIPGVLHAMWNSAQNYRDATQARLPSYRDRIVEIRLTDREGGLNLAMDPETIKVMAAKGAAAGTALNDQFNFDHHRWVRLQVVMSQLEAQLTRLMETFDAAGYKELIAGVQTTGGYPYDRSKSWNDSAIRRMESIERLLTEWNAIQTEFRDANPNWPDPSQFFSSNSPRPTGVLRVTPDI